MASNSRKRIFWIGVAADVFLIAAVSVTSIMMRQFLEPFHQGFFRDDESLMYPYNPSSVTSVTLYTIGFIPTSVVVIVKEFYNIRLNSRRNLRNKDETHLTQGQPNWNLATWRCFRILCSFYFGAAVTHALTNLGKYTMGSLRPHFMDVCQPDWSLLGNDTSRYVSKDICTQTDEKKMTEARLSFPSGHSSIAMYCAIFFCIYLHQRFRSRRVVLLSPLFQLCIFGAATYTMMTRIQDNKHHGKDTIAGGLLGAAIAVLAMLRIARIFRGKKFHNDKHLQSCTSDCRPQDSNHSNYTISNSTFI